MNQVTEGLGYQPGVGATPAGILARLVPHLDGLLRAIGFRLNRTLPRDGSERMAAPLPLATYTVATRPPASASPGAVIYVSDGGAGAVFQGSNGTAWVNLG